MARPPCGFGRPDPPSVSDPGDPESGRTYRGIHRDPLAGRTLPGRPAHTLSPGSSRPRSRDAARAGTPRTLDPLRALLARAGYRPGHGGNELTLCRGICVLVTEFGGGSGCRHELGGGSGILTAAA